MGVMGGWEGGWGQICVVDRPHYDAVGAEHQRGIPQ